jgi:hypothetical protein
VKIPFLKFCDMILKTKERMLVMFSFRNKDGLEIFLISLVYLLLLFLILLIGAFIYDLNAPIKEMSGTIQKTNSPEENGVMLIGKSVIPTHEDESFYFKVNGEEYEVNEKVWKKYKNGEKISFQYKDGILAKPIEKIYK